MFAANYIEKNVVYRRFIYAPADSGLKIIVVIPCLNEPDVLCTLESLWQCRPPKSECEVIVAVNNSENASDQIKVFNQKTFEELLDWKKRNNRKDLTLYPIYASAVETRSAGAGMARKIGMDEATRRFNDLNRPEGVIVSLDADCLVSPNYLQEIEQTFFPNKNCFAATLNFSHRIDEMTDERQQEGIQLYENYLYYYKKALEYIGYPNAIYTIGSAFAVTAGAYVKQGGMNRKQAGEDFYFLNKLCSLGKVTEITNAWVYPSARVSDRVPFGTGAALTKWMDNKTDLTTTYNFSAFADLKQLFDLTGAFYRVDGNNLTQLIEQLALPVLEYLKAVNFKLKIAEINKYSSTPEAFRKRFFQFFDAFLIMRFLNTSHLHYYQRQNLGEAIELLDINYSSIL